jgi:hypothetical protein
VEIRTIKQLYKLMRNIKGFYFVRNLISYPVKKEDWWLHHPDSEHGVYIHDEVMNDFAISEICNYARFENMTVLRFFDLDKFWRVVQTKEFDGVLNYSTKQIYSTEEYVKEYIEKVKYEKS